MFKKYIYTWIIYVCFCALPEKAVPVEAVEAVKKDETQKRQRVKFTAV